MIEAVMLWNEPNNLSHWDFELDPEWMIFSEMTCLAADAVRSVAPSMPCVLGGLSPIDPLFIQRMSNQGVLDKVDVIAHCMGAVVFSIAVLSGGVPGLVGRAAFTQVGPLVVFSPANIFRAYALRYLINLLPDNYSFNPADLFIFLLAQHGQGLHQLLLLIRV